MEKHINTKYSKKSYKCHEVFESETVLKSRTEEEHKSEYISQSAAKLDSEPIIPECSLCEDRFPSQIEYTEHFTTNIDEIHGIDKEDLKNRHEVFECSLTVVYGLIWTNLVQS